ncbi:serine/threonine-protein kinase [Nocardia sp. AG03]|uniref:WD40 repeat domain-containing serine/threonine protein kinase n=1 Tax=Nocardia sp. AG03 TaxID=3025312 RepID=UPI0024182209|nr:serine/threonine-protein kinase [Nocardia sp. AG03]
MRLAPGTVVGGYVIERLLGAGGMGAVYLARHPRMDRRVALKVLEETADSDAKMRRNFEREATLAASLEHPNIVPVYDHSSPDEPRLWIAMKYVVGQDASVLVRQQGPLPLARAAQLISDIAAGLDHAHRAGVLHRDVKPANMLVEVGPDGRERALVTDFGIARAADHTLTMSGIMASFAYTAPERFLGSPADQRADVYSLGCSLYELLTGRTPFESTEQATMVAAHLTATPPRCTQARPDLPHGVDEVITRALAKHPDDRFTSCGELATAFSELTRAQPDTAVSSRKIGRRQVLIGAAVIAPIAVAGTTIPLLLHRDSPSTSAATPPTRRTPTADFRTTLPTRDSVRHCSFSRDGSQIFGDRRIWDVATTNITREFDKPVLAWSPDGAVVALQNSGAPMARTSDGTPVGPPLTGGDQHTAAFSPDSSLLATAGTTGTVVRLWNTRTGQPTGELVGHGDTVRAIAFSPDGTVLATGGFDRTVRFWSIPAQQPIGQPLAHQATITSLAFSPDGTMLAAVEGENIQLWQLDAHITATKVSPWKDSRSNSYNAVTFSPDGTALAAVGDKTQLWDTRTRQPITPFTTSGGNALAVDPTGTVLAIGTDTGVALWTLTLPE